MHYTPRNPAYAAMNAMFMRRQFRTVCRDILGGLKAFTETRQAAPAD